MSEEQALAITPKNGAALAAPIETAAAGVAAQMEAQIKARYSLAVMHPRDIDMVRTRLLKACNRPRFAESARYKLPRNKKVKDRNGVERYVPIEGPSIRFAEEAARSLGNVAIETMIIHEDPERRLVRVMAIDIEANLPFSQDIVVEKFVERSQLKNGQKAISSRMNSYGTVVYRVEADEGELLLKQAALTSKAMRNLILRILPADILEDAMDACVKTMANVDAQDPDATRKTILDRFESIGVSPAELKAYLGHELARVSPAQFQELRDLFTALKENATTWAEVMEGKSTAEKKAEGAAAPQTLEEKAAAKKKAKAEEPKPAADAPKGEREPGSDG